MQELEIIVIVGTAVFAGAALSPRLRVPGPLLLLLIGAAMGFVPQLRHVQLQPEIVLLLFLPAILFWEALTTSLRAVRRDFRGIVLMSTLLVVVSAFAVAWIASRLGFPWPVAFVLGSAVAPPDATAVAALGKSLPHRNFMLLKAESLTNDGTALVVYAIAVALATGRPIPPGRIALMVAESYVGGILIGALLAGIAFMLLRRLHSALAINLGLCVLPFAAYLAAEAVHASGVLAVVVAGLFVTALAPRMSTAASRRQTEDVWPLVSFLLNGALFVLIGLKLHDLVRALPLATMARLSLVAVAAWLGLILVRLAFQTVAGTTMGLIHRGTEIQERVLPHRARVVSAFAGFRGGVSLAIALSVPLVLDDGRPFPQRQELVFVTAGVIVLTLFVQGPLLPWITRWANLPEEVSTDDELRYAELELSRAARHDLAELADARDLSRQARERVARQLEEQERVLHARKATEASHPDELPEVPHGEAVPQEHHHLTLADECTQLRLALLDRKRERLAELRSEGAIDDTVVRQVQMRIDIEEIRLAGAAPIEE